MEVEAVVADYFAMLDAEIRHEPYTKSVHRRALSAMLNGRSDGSIERKHQNISAILIELHHPFVFGYKPLGNYQALLERVVVERVSTDLAFAARVSQAVDEPAPVPTVNDILARLEPSPQRDPVSYSRIMEQKEWQPRRYVVDYLEREARNSSLGRAGEEFVLNFERARLIHANRDSLAARVEHTSVAEGDGAGFDIRSFETDGSDRLIEVKTTAYGKQTPIFLSSNELETSREHRNSYHLYRPFRFRADPRLFAVRGALDEVCSIEATEFRGRFG
ncbi:MAG: DUF3883 domain-containing protein [Gemmatimonadaceae bacterium]